MYDNFGYGQPMMQQMRQNDWQQRVQARNAPRYEVIQVNAKTAQGRLPWPRTAPRC